MKIHFHSDSEQSSKPRGRAGFTLLEVMIACFVFFVVAFSVLQMTTVSIMAAKSLQKNNLDPGMIAAEVTSTNRIYEEGTYSGDFQDIYPDFSWEYTVQQVESNGLFQIEFLVIPKAGGASGAAKITTLVHSPGSTPGVGFGGIKP